MKETKREVKRARERQTDGYLGSIPKDIPKYISYSFKCGQILI